MSIDVLDKGFVRLVGHMGSDLNVINSARVSFGKKKDIFDNKDSKLLRYLWNHGHTSPFRHASLQFHIKAPIFVFRQWHKHQVGCSWNEISGRYVEFTPEFYYPSKYRRQSKNNKQGSFGEIDCSDEVSRIYDTCMVYAYRDYVRLLELGVCKEQARLVLPVSLYSECYWTCSLQAVLHFLKLRLDSHAQLEIREYAKAVKSMVTDIFPHTMEMIYGSE